MLNILISSNRGPIPEALAIFMKNISFNASWNILMKLFELYLMHLAANSESYEH
jgi:hypothetical protein